MRFPSKKKMTILIVFLAFLVVSNIIIPIFKQVNTTPKSLYTVVIDAGHGARDGGCIGVNGSVEKDLNLKYAKALKGLLETKDIKVVMTRENDNALYDEDANNKKLTEMKARENCIRSAKPDLVVSIHMNSFALKSVKGAKVFYSIDSDSSKTVATDIQKSMHYFAGAKSLTPAVGDYYILNCTNYTSVLIECGYISNPEEEALLNTEEYKNKLMHSVYAGILIYLGFNYY